MSCQVYQSGPTGSPLKAASVSSPKPLLCAPGYLGRQLTAFSPPPRARSTLPLTQQVQPLALCCFTPLSLKSPLLACHSPALFQAGLCPLSLMAYGDARLSSHTNPICKFLPPLSDAATQGPLLPPVHCQCPHLSH